MTTTLVRPYAPAMRGITMEYLSKVPNPPSGDRMTMQMGVTGLSLWTLYTLVYTMPNLEELVLTPMRASKMSTLYITALYLTHMLSRGMASKTIVMLVSRGGATVLSLAQVVRSSLIIVLSSVLFCGSDPRQCLDGVGLVSVALVIAGGAVYGVAKKLPSAGSSSHSTSTKTERTTRTTRTRTKKSVKSDDDDDDDVDDKTEETVVASPAVPTTTRRRASVAASAAATTITGTAENKKKKSSSSRTTKRVA